MRRLLPLALAVLVLFVACEPAPTSSATSGSSARTHHLVNSARAAHGLGGLPRASVLDAKAQSHAEWMAANRKMAHSDLDAGVPAGWQTLAENVGYGSSPDSVHHNFMHSGPHRGNILGSRFRDLGVGTARGSDGRLYVAIVFRG